MGSLDNHEVDPITVVYKPLFFLSHTVQAYTTDSGAPMILGEALLVKVSSCCC